MDVDHSNRWLIAAAGVVMQVALGAVYAWSVFRIPLTLTFELAILVLGFASFAGGLLMARVGPRRVAIAAGLCYGLGTILAGRADGSISWLYLSYGVLGGIGLGLGYIVPLATLIKWFPDRRGMITGLAVAGFGAGALVTALVAVVGAALFMKNPPEAYRPDGWQPPATQQSERASKDYTLGEALQSWQWYALSPKRSI